MDRLVRCTRKSHCLRFNPERRSYEGEGQLIPKSTAAGHRLDDRLSQILNNVATTVATRILRRFLSPDAAEEAAHSPADDYSFVLEAEILRRCVWTLGNDSLVFAINPSPSLEYQYPAGNEVYICNRGPYALLPGNAANTAYLENSIDDIQSIDGNQCSPRC